jgi:uncharacterized protein YbjT (DUF2867 family)
MPDIQRVLLTGATGFVGNHLYDKLVAAGFNVLCGTRQPAKALKQHPTRTFTNLDVYDYQSTLAALRGCDAAVYLVHGMADRKDYEKAEQRAAQNFVRAAEQAGIKRIVYLGGIKPQAKKVSRHLRSRLKTGEILRGGRVSTVELQATMVIGPGSESWRIVRDLAARLPFMVLPSWLDSRSQPLYIDDATSAILHALTMEQQGSAAYPLPGPEIITAREIIVRTARLMGLNPRMMRVPVFTPRLSSYWITLVTRANPRVSRELVEGLRSDLIAFDRGFWKLMPEHQLVPFDEAARRALIAEARGLSLKTRLAEWVIHRLTPSVSKGGAGRAAL